MFRICLSVQEEGSTASSKYWEYPEVTVEPKGTADQTLGSFTGYW